METILTDLAARTVMAEKIYSAGDSEVRALDGVSLDIKRGEFTAIMGPSGSGKSTLMHCLAGLDQLTSGNVYIGETDISKLNEKNLTLLRRERVGFIFQAFNLIPTLSAKENIVLPQRLGGATTDPEWLSQVIAAVGLQDRLSHRPNELSGGQQQWLVQCAGSRALLHNDKVSQPNLFLLPH